MHAPKQKTALTLSFLLACTFSFAQTAPDPGALLRESTGVTPAPPELPAQRSVTPAAPVSGQRVFIKSFVIRGAERFSSETLLTELKDLTGRELAFEQLQAAADRVSLFYRENGLHAIALLPEQSLSTGVVEILVVEGKVGRFAFEWPVEADRVPKQLLSGIVQQGQRQGDILNVDSLERATLVANDVPGLKVSTVLRAGARAGETDVMTLAQLQPVLAGSVNADNADPAATGRNKLAASVSLSNPLGMGEQFTSSAQRSEGKTYASLGANFPLNRSGLRASVGYSRLDYELLNGLASSGGKGNAQTWTGQLNYPFIRQQQLNLLGQLGYSHSHLLNDSTAGNLSDKKNENSTLGLELNRNDDLWGGGVTMAGLTYTSGTVDLGGSAGELAQDAAGIRRNGSFSKLSYHAGRLQRLGAQSLLWFNVAGQVASKNLDSSDEHSLGGPNAVRAYPSLEGSGDEGQVLTIEYRRDLPWQLRGKLFYDWGQTRVNRDNSFAGGATKNEYALEGIGLGVDWNPYPQWSVRASLAWRMGDNPAPQASGNDNDGSRRVPQFWLFAQLDF